MTGFLARVDQIDLAIDRALLHVRGGPVDRIFYAASEAANHSMLWHGLGALSAALPGGTRRTATEMSVVMGIESALVNGALKSLFRRPRPAVREHPHQLRVPRTSSFPSGHASSAFTAVAVLSRRRPSWRLPLTGVATLVAVSRTWVGIHHASDVVGGVIVGKALGATAVVVLDRLER